MLLCGDDKLIMSRQIGECLSFPAGQSVVTTNVHHTSFRQNHNSEPFGPYFFSYKFPTVCGVFSSHFFGNANNINFKYLFRAHQVCLETPKSCFALLKVSTEKRRATAGTKFPARAKEPKTLKRGKLDRSRKGHLLPLLRC